MPQEFYTKELFLASFFNQETDSTKLSTAFNGVSSLAAVSQTDACKGVADADEAAAIAAADAAYAMERGAAEKAFDACRINGGPAYATREKQPCKDGATLIDGVCYTPNGDSSCPPCGQQCILDLQIAINTAESKRQQAVNAAKTAKLNAYKDCYKKYGDPNEWSYPRTTGRRISGARPGGIQGVGIGTGGSTRSKD